MTDTKSPSPLTLAAKAYELAFELNANPALESDPCRAAFETARQILLAIYSPDCVREVDDRAVSTHEFTEADLARYVREWSEDTASWDRYVHETENDQEEEKSSLLRWLNYEDI